MKKILISVVGIIIIFFSCFIIYEKFFDKSYLPPTQLDKKSFQTTQPTVTVILSSPETNSSWQPYTSAQLITNAGLSINYPTGWKVNIKKETNLSSDYTANFRIGFDFLPPGKQVNRQSVDWMGWGEMSVDVYNAKADINQWIHDYLPKYQQDITVSSTRMIGNKQAYYLTAKSISPLSAGWAPRYIILGKNYSYELGFGQNGETGFNTRLENEIYPTIFFI